MAQSLKLQCMQSTISSLRSTPHRSSLHSHGMLSRSALCRAAPTQKGTEKNDIRGSNSNDFPVFESEEDDQGEFLPVRNPGTFPNIAVRGRCLCNSTVCC